MSGTNILQSICSTEQFVAPVNGEPSDGLLLISEANGVGAGTQTSYYTYYPSNAVVEANKLQRMDNPDGSWKILCL